VAPVTKPRLVAEQEGDERSDLVRAGDPPGRVGHVQGGPVDVRADAEQLAIQRSLDSAGDQRIDADAVGSVGPARRPA
jgi:hypothetical protein